MSDHRAAMTALAAVLMLAAAMPAGAQTRPVTSAHGEAGQSAASPSATVPGDTTPDATTQNAANAGTADDVIVTGTRAGGRPHPARQRFAR